jgi:hypothetical protein
MNIYDIGIEPGGVHTINVQADYIYFRTGSAGGGDTTVVFQPNAGGESVYLQPGQAYKMPAAMSGKNVTWTLRNLKGEGKIGGVILMGEGEFQDNRVSGSVEVIDGGKARTLAGFAYMGAGAILGEASKYPHVQLFNPAESGRNIVLESMLISVTLASTVDFGPQAVQLAEVFPAAPVSKKFKAGATPTVGVIRRQNAVSNQLGNAFANIMVQPSATVPIVFTEPVVIMPGMGMMVQSESVNNTMAVTFEYFEESVL